MVSTPIRLSGESAPSTAVTTARNEKAISGIDRPNVGYLGTSDEAHHGARKMPFSNHYIIEPEHVEVMRSAFGKVCDALLLRCDVDDPMMKIIVNKIVAHATSGEHDAECLAEKVLDDLADEAA
jgi:hypothetical protein